MKKQTGSILLIAGTCIGSGMIALPLVLAKIGIIPSILVMIITWLLMYFSALITVELNLQAGKGLPLGAIGRKYSGILAEITGTVAFKTLSFALVAVYIYAGSSVLEKMFSVAFQATYQFQSIASIYALAIIFLLLLPIKIIDLINRIFFACLILSIIILIAGLSFTIDWSHLPLVSPSWRDIKAWHILVPVIFTSFGFQGTCHTLVNYCELDKKTLHKALIWGSFIPLVVYVLWNSICLAAVYNHKPNFYYQMENGIIDVGELVHILGELIKWQSMQILVWLLTTFAIVTSVLGVGISLCDSIREILARRVKNNLWCKLLSVIITVLPAYIMAVAVPGAFIKILGFAGMILAVIAIVLPVYLLLRLKVKKLHYKALGNLNLVLLTLVGGVFVILCELWNMSAKF